MLSYRHGFHAGNFADVLKHSVLTLVINALKRKDKPFVYIDTHAGAGKYGLMDEFAQKTGEYQQGIARLWQQAEAQAHPLLKDYLAAVRAENMGQQLQRYPGSPQLARRLIRAKDRMRLSELHPSDFQMLSQLFAGDMQVSVQKEDGLAMLSKKLPPIQKRGVILIDPSYELKSDYRQVVEALITAYRHFATGTYVLWYPVIERAITEKLMDNLIATGIPKQLRLEHGVQPDGYGHGLTGSGLLLINPPWQLDTQANELLPYLNQQLADGKGTWRVFWQVSEQE